MTDEVISTALINGDSTNPIQATIKETSEPFINGLVVTNPDGSSIPAGIDNESIRLLRRMVKLLESNATVDVANRQRVAVESAIITSGTVTTVSTVSNLALIAGVDPRYTFIDQARMAYNTGIRSNLSFT